jgi:hypothetical protein
MPTPSCYNRHALLPLFLLVLLPLASAKGEGCEKQLDKYCPSWRAGGAACIACVNKELSKLEPECSKSKALRKCSLAPGPSPGPSPGPGPSPSPPPPPPPLPPRPSPPPSSTPNIFLMLTDDQDIMLGSMNAMSFTRGLAARGANLTQFRAHTPVCCPSRSELLTGRYFHNIRTSSFDDKSGNQCMHVNASVAGTKTGNPLTFATRLEAAGYATGYFGKVRQGDEGRGCTWGGAL